MTMSEWARNEVNIACKKENPNKEDCEWDYGCACYESALKAFKSLTEDGHSGFSFSMTAGILKRLLDHDPLTPIYDDETWGESDQCQRMSSLFREVDKNTGEVTYTDVERVICHDGDGSTYTNGFIRTVVDKMFPITMPYYPDGRYYVIMHKFSTTNDPDNWNTMRMVEIKKPDGETLNPELYWKETETGELVEITKEEFMTRFEMSKLHGSNSMFL